MKKMSMIAALVFGSVTAANAFEVEQNVDLKSAQAAYPYKILGLQAGMTFEEVEQAVAERDMVLYVDEGTNTLSGGSKSVSYDTQMSFNTMGFDNIYMYRNLDEYDRMGGEISSPAAGSVTTSIERSFKMPAVDAPSWESILKQLTDAYGEPSYASPLGENVWVLNAAGEQVAGNPAETEECVVPAWGFRYMDEQELDQEFCSASFTVKGDKGPHGLVVSFRIQDISLQIADIASMSAQIEAEMAQDTEASNLDL